MMANEKNVAALFSILGWDANAAFSRIIRDEVTAAETMEFAKALTACGVLVPSALTDGECGDIWFAGESRYTPDMRAVIERIAKGEAKPE
jgi:hypothetical protein